MTEDSPGRGQADARVTRWCYGQLAPTGRTVNERGSDTMPELPTNAPQTQVPAVTQAPAQTPAPVPAPQSVQSPAPATQTPTPAPAQQAVQPALQQAPANQQQPTPEMLDFGGLKLPASQETKALYDTWRNQQKALTQSQQETAQLRQQAEQAVKLQEQLKAIVSPNQQQTPAQQQAAQSIFASLPPAQRAQLGEQLISGILGGEADGALTALDQVLTPVITQIVEARVQAPTQQVQQLQEQIRMDQNVQATAAKYGGDFYDQIPAIKAALDANPYLYQAPNAVEAAYLHVKAQSAAQAQPAPTLDQMLQDPATVEKIIGNQNITNQILARHAQAIANGAPPPVIAGNTPGVPPVKPAEAPKTIKQATDLLMAQWGLQG